MSKMSFSEFIKKLQFIVGNGVSLDDLYLDNVEIYHINEFSKLENEKFVEEMYKLLLRRVYDEGGKQGKLSELKNGKSKEDIIRDMINSEEGQNYIGIYEILGIDYEFSFFEEDVLFKSDLSEKDFENLVEFLNFKFKNLPTNIIDLLNYSGSEFVFLLYKIILKRNPDYIGFKHHLNGSYLLEDKFNKVKNFLSSDEAKGKNSSLYNLKGKNILEVSIKEVFDIKEGSITSFNEKVVLFNYFNNKSLFESICLLSSICEEPEKIFYFIVNKIFFENKTLVEAIYEKEFLSSLKDEYLLIDYYNKPLTPFNFSNIDDMVRNNFYYISIKNSLFKDYINKFNLIINIQSNLNKELLKIAKFFKRVALKSDLNKLYRNDKILEKNFNALVDMVKEHENFILRENSLGNSGNYSKKHYKRRNRKK